MLQFVPIAPWEISTSQTSSRTAMTSKSVKFLKYVEENFSSQVLSEPTRKGALLDLLYSNREGLMGDAIVGGCLGHSDHEMVEFKISM